MASANGERGPGAPRPVSALPSVNARVLAFGAIVVAGVCGGLIGYSAVKVACHGNGPLVAGVPRAPSSNCATPEGVGGLVGALLAAAGVAVISVLVLRAMGEWRSIKDKRQLETLIAAASHMLTPNRAGPAEPGDTSVAHGEESAQESVTPPEGETSTGPISHGDLGPPPWPERPDGRQTDQ